MLKITENQRLGSAQLFGELQALERSCGDANKHEKVTVLILACIERGINTKSAIIGVITHLGFNNRHVAIVLDEGAGPNPERHHWRFHSSGLYEAWA